MRHPEWQKRLADVIAASEREHFAYGRHDCVQFAFRCAASVTGRKCIPAHRNYKSKRGSQTAMRRAGFKSLGEVVGSVFELLSFPLLAQRGDIVLIDSTNGDALGVVGIDGATVHCLGPQGFQNLPLSRAIQAWRVQ
jgi:hypothetical protein